MQLDGAKFGTGYVHRQYSDMIEICNFCAENIASLIVGAENIASLIVGAENENSKSSPLVGVQIHCKFSYWKPWRSIMLRHWLQFLLFISKPLSYPILSYPS